MKCPLTKAQLNAVKAAYSTYTQVEREIELAERAGIDCSEERAVCSHMKQAADAIIKTYGPALYSQNPDSVGS